MPTQPSLLKAITDDHRVFEKDIGCMTGIHQIFDYHPNLTDQSYGSWCNGTHNGSSYLSQTDEIKTCLASENE
jgi:hypothetical protein